MRCRHTELYAAETAPYSGIKEFLRRACFSLLSLLFIFARAAIIFLTAFFEMPCQHKASVSVLYTSSRSKYNNADGYLKTHLHFTGFPIAACDGISYYQEILKLSSFLQ